MPRTSLLPLLTLVAACGCSSLGAISGMNPFAKKFVTADAANPAVEVACMWQPGEGPNENGIPARGFAGQVFFFTKKGDEPVLVDGTIRFYLFADRGAPEERGKPLKQFDFTPEAWALHATLTSLGPGYSVFIPYPQSEPYQVRCQLRARFIPKEGPTIWSEAVTLTLEGPPQPGAEPAWWSNVDRTKSPPTVIDAQVTHETRSAAQLAAAKTEAQVPPRKLRTETIPLGEIQQTAYEVPARPIGEEADDDLGGIDPAVLKDLLREQAKKRAPRTWHPLHERDEVSPDAEETSPRQSERGSTVHPLGDTRPQPAVPADGRAHPLSQVRHGKSRSFTRPAHPLSQRAGWQPLGSSLPPIASVSQGATASPSASSDASNGTPNTDASAVFGDWRPAGQ